MGHGQLASNLNYVEIGGKEGALDRWHELDSGFPGYYIVGFCRRSAP